MVGAHIGERVQAALARAVVLAFAFVLLAPVALGPAYAPAVRLLGGEAKHLCACGMVVGQCGCPECERAERQRHRDEAPKPYPVCKTKCGGDDVPLAFAPPPVAAPAAVDVSLPPAETADATTPAVPDWHSQTSVRPPTPPPEARPLSA